MASGREVGLHPRGNVSTFVIGSSETNRSFDPCVRLMARRPLSALFVLLYLLLAAGGEALQHGWSDPAPAYAETHVHAPDGQDHDCPPPPHDENHCPACKLAGLHFLPPESGAHALASAPAAVRVTAAGDEPAPALRSHAPPSLRAPPIG